MHVGYRTLSRGVLRPLVATNPPAMAPRMFARSQFRSYYACTPRPEFSASFLVARGHGVSSHSTPLVRLYSSRPSPSPTTAQPSNVATDTDTPAAWPLLKKIIHFARPEYPLLAGASVMLLASSAVTLSIPYFMGRIVDMITTESLPQLVSMYPYIIAFFAAGAAANATRQFLFRYAGDRLVTRLRTLLYSTYLTRSLSFHDTTTTGDLLSRLSSDTSVIAKSMSVNLSDGVRSLVMTVAGGVMLYWMSAELTVVMVCVLPVLAVAGRYYGIFVRTLSSKTQDSLASAVSLAEEKISNIRTVRAFAMEEVEERAFEDKIDKVLALARTEHLATAGFFSSAGFVGNLTILGVLYLGSHLVATSALTIGSLTSFLIYTGYTGGSLMALGGFYSDVQKGLGAAGRVGKVVGWTGSAVSESESESGSGKVRPEQVGKDWNPVGSESGHAVVDTTSDTGLTLPTLHGHLTFTDVHFHYPTRPLAPVFTGLTLSVTAGQVVGIVGQSGGGKSTVGNLLLRFYDPTRGTVAVDGVDLKELNPRWWRKQVGVVSQEPVLFTGTIAQNIAYGLGVDATTLEIMERVLHAAELANARAFVEALPDGFDTLVGERGVNLSGGQRQRISIARAVVGDPKVLLLDEATSALDAESEHLVQQALDRLMVGRTVIMIAHRLSTIRKAHKIVVVDGGCVQEEGSWEELMEKPEGVFRKLVRRQHGLDAKTSGTWPR